MSKKEEDSLEERILILNDVDEDSTSNLINSLFSLVQKDRKNPINIVVNSFGGSIYDMFAAYDAIQYVKSLGVPVITIGIGKIMSSGVIIFVAGSVRKIGKHATIMWHYGKDVISGNLVEIQNDLDEFRRLEEMGNDVLRNHTKMSKEQIDEMMSSRLDIYISANKAIALGIADSLLESPIQMNDNTKTKGRLKQNV